MTIEITVKTKQKISKVEKIDDKTYKVFVKSTPTQNKANIEIVKLLSDYFNVAKSNIKIKLGGKLSVLSNPAFSKSPMDFIMFLILSKASLSSLAL